jgi:hypothetical protein
MLAGTFGLASTGLDRGILNEPVGITEEKLLAFLQSMA